MLLGLLFLQTTQQFEEEVANVPQVAPESFNPFEQPYSAAGAVRGHVIVMCGRPCGCETSSAVATGPISWSHAVTGCQLQHSHCKSRQVRVL